MEQEERLATELERRKTEKLRLEKLRQQIRDNRFAYTLDKQLIHFIIVISSDWIK